MRRHHRPDYRWSYKAADIDRGAIGQWRDRFRDAQKADKA